MPSTLIGPPALRSASLRRLIRQSWRRRESPPVRHFLRTALAQAKSCRGGA